MTNHRWNFEDAAREQWTVLTVGSIVTLSGLALFAALFLN